MTQILIDTNMFLSIFELNVDLISRIEDNYGKNKVFTLDIVTDELKNKGKHGQAALQLIQALQIPVETYKGDKQADEAILDYAEQHNCILATQDKELAQKAKRKALKTLRIRSKSYLIE